MAVVSRGRRLIARKAVERFLRMGQDDPAFRVCLDILKGGYESPIPDLTRLGARGPDFWERERPCSGVDFREKDQLRFMEENLKPYAQECNFPLEEKESETGYFIRNNAFGFISAASLHCMIRHFRPVRIIEVGSGFSTLAAAAAVEKNKEEGHECELYAIDPFPRIPLENVRGIAKRIPEKLEDVDRDLFGELGERDILFIDSSHVVRTGGDIVKIYLEILPELADGVVVHIHDIFLPFEYPKQVVCDQRKFWTEQYLLQAFLAFNSSWSVLWAATLLSKRYLEQLKDCFPPPRNLTAVGDGLTMAPVDHYRSSSFWMQRKASGDHDKE